MTAKDEQNKRIAILENILLRLHNGASQADVQADFNAHFTDVSAMEIAMMEHQLMYGDSEVTFEDVLKLCNVHAELFKDSIEDKVSDEIDKPGHPVRVFKEENMALRAALMRINNILNALSRMDTADVEDGILRGLTRQYELIGEFDKHYQRKEKLFFPLMERYGHDAPPKVMWAKDDEIRGLFKCAKQSMADYPNTPIATVQQHFTAFQEEFEGMIFKEESILLNILIETLSLEDWYQIAKESDAYGYAILPGVEIWEPEQFELTEEKTIDSTSFTTKNEKITVNQLETQKLTLSEGALTLIWENSKPEMQPSQRLNRDVAFPIGDGLLSINQIDMLLEYNLADLTFFSLDKKMVYFNHQSRSQTRFRTKKQLGLSMSQIYPKEMWQQLAEPIESLLKGQEEKVSYWFKREQEFLNMGYQIIYNLQHQPLGILEVVLDTQPYLDIDIPVSRQLLAISEFDAIEPQRIQFIKDDVSSEILQQVNLGGSTYTLTRQLGETNELAMSDINYRYPLQNGGITVAEIQGILNALPFELTFVDNKNIFQYFNTRGPYDEMIFKRTPIQIGRSLELCHPAQIWPMIEQLFQSFKAQTRHYQTMWYPQGDKWVYVHYQATYDQDNNYLGVIESVFDIQPYRDEATQPKPLI